MKQFYEIINLLGGVRKVSQLLGVHRTRVYVWLRPVSKGGTGGRIPIKHIPILLNEAKRIGAPIKAEDFFSFFYGAQSYDTISPQISSFTTAPTDDNEHQQHNF
ncbi:hypothetical protein [Bartonella tribocorum]|uniref:hypothetical protein n=1 Tax=Bartonella tribocorum TaxID=85701 RepID=UPI00043AEDE8|nr:hypothetical protein [Bartonella tribocorum]CDO48028.1 hypothetical protein BM1374166_00336 [Bartonella tribocorum]